MALKPRFGLAPLCQGSGAPTREDVKRKADCLLATSEACCLPRVVIDELLRERCNGGKLPFSLLVLHLLGCCRPRAAPLALRHTARSPSGLDFGTSRNLGWNQGIWTVRSRSRTSFLCLFSGRASLLSHAHDFLRDAGQHLACAEPFYHRWR